MTNDAIYMGVFETPEAAREAVAALRAAGLTRREISVVSSRPTGIAELDRLEDQEPAGAKVDEVLKGAAVGTAGLGAVGVGAAAAATAAGAISAAGAAILTVGILPGLAVAGTLIALMMTRGVEKELADYYDQALQEGKIIVGIETDDPSRRAAGTDILERRSVRAVRLPKEPMTS